jgi:hypothetical protein
MLAIKPKWAAQGAAQVAPSAQCAPTARTTATVNLREGPGTDYAVMLTIPRGATLSVAGKNQDGTWYQVLYQGVKGWVSVQYLQLSCVEGVIVVDVAPPAPTSAPPPTATPSTQTPGVSLTASANSVNIGNCAIVYWNVSNVDQAYVGTGSWQVSAQPAGSQQVCPTMSTTYYVRTMKNGASTLHPLEITVINPQNPANFRSNAYVLNPGLCATLRWDISNVQGVYLYLNGQFQGVAGNGSQQVCVSSPAQYGLKVIYNTGQQVYTPLTINVTTQPPGNIQFLASPTTINQGECSTLSWIVGNAKSVVLIDSSSGSATLVGTSGQIVVCPTVTAQYTIQAQIEAGKTAQTTQTVTVMGGVPTPIPMATPIP